MSSVKTYSTKPDYVDAIQVTQDNLSDILYFLGGDTTWLMGPNGLLEVRHRLEWNPMHDSFIAFPGDYIVRFKNVDDRMWIGKFAVISAARFEENYHEVKTQ